MKTAIPPRTDITHSTLMTRIGWAVYILGAVLTFAGLAVLKGVIQLGPDSTDISLSLMLAGLFVLLVGVAID